MAVIMVVATTMHLTHGDGMAVASHAIEDGVVFASLILIGASSCSLDHWQGARRIGQLGYHLPSGA